MNFREEREQFLVDQLRALQKYGEYISRQSASTLDIALEAEALAQYAEQFRNKPIAFQDIHVSKNKVYQNVLKFIPIYLTVNTHHSASEAKDEIKKNVQFAIDKIRMLLNAESDIARAA